MARIDELETLYGWLDQAARMLPVCGFEPDCEIADDLETVLCSAALQIAYEVDPKNRTEIFAYAGAEDPRICRALVIHFLRQTPEGESDKSPLWKAVHRLRPDYASKAPSWADTPDALAQWFLAEDFFYRKTGCRSKL